jgi:phthiodiolone/phenolphthiodiolone dimycocerosates ketoreductase
MDPSFGIGIALPSTPPLDDLLRGVALAHGLGLDVVSVSDHLTEFSLTGAGDTASFESQTILGALSSRVESIRLGVGVTDVLRRHPIIVGQAMLTLSHLTRRPPILGIGAGESLNTQPYGLASDGPVARLEEALRLLRAWFDGDPPVDMAGRHLRLDGARLDLRPPADRRPSIWIGAHGPRMLALTGRFGDGWYPADIVDPAEYGARLAVVRNAASEAGRDPQAIVAAGELVVFAGETDEDAAALLETPEAKLAGLLLPEAAWAERGLRHPLGHGFRGFVDYRPGDANLDAAERVPPELVAEHVLWGSPETIARRVAALRGVGLSHVNLAFGSISEVIADGDVLPTIIGCIRAATRRVT